MVDYFNVFKPNHLFALKHVYFQLQLVNEMNRNVSVSPNPAATIWGNFICVALPNIAHKQNWKLWFCAPGLPQSGSWQDLKDHMREAGDVCYADVFRDGTGVVEFVRKEDMTYAVRKLDNTKFRSHEVCVLI